MKSLLAVVGVAVGLAVTSIVRGFVLAKLWLWFVASQFKVSELSVAGAMGLSIIVSMLVYQGNGSKKEEDKDSKKVAWTALVEGLLTSLLMSLFFLSLGWLTKQFLVQ